MPYTLTNSDWRNINQTIYGINVEDDRSTFLFNVMKHLDLVCPYTCGIFTQARVGHNGIVIENSVGVNLLPEDTELINKYCLAGSPFIRGVCMLPNGSVTCGFSCDQFTESQRMNFRESIIPRNPNNTLTTVLYHDSLLQGFILLMRRDEVKPFSAAHICAMDVLQPHISLQFNKVMNSDEPEAVNNDKYKLLDIIADRFNLTKRELEVLKNMYDHKSDDEICYSLFITKSTLKKHISHIYGKMSVRNRSELFKAFDPDLYNV